MSTTVQKGPVADSATSILRPTESLRWPKRAGNRIFLVYWNKMTCDDLPGGSVSEIPAPNPGPPGPGVMPHPLNYAEQNGKGARGKGRGGHVGLNCTPLGKEEAKGRNIADLRNSVQRPAYGSVSHGT